MSDNFFFNYEVILGFQIFVVKMKTKKEHLLSIET